MTTTPEHSDIVGGSTASRRLNCPRSYALEQKVPDVQTSSEYAREGTALHELMAKILLEDVEPAELLPFTYSREATDTEEAWSFTVDEDLWLDLGQPALDAFDDYGEGLEREYGAEVEFLVEKRCELPGIDGAFGTSDIIWRCGDAIGIWDWKFGSGLVGAEENAQLMFYACAAMYTHAEFLKTVGEVDGSRLVHLAICQPRRREEPDEWLTTISDLETFRRELVKAVNLAKTDKAPIKRGPWCQFAPCKAICPLFTNTTAELARKMEEVGVLAEKAEVTPEVEFKELLADLLDMAEVAEDYARHLFAFAHGYAEQHGAPEGWQLEHKRSADRKYAVEEEDVVRFMRGRRFKIDEYLPRRLLSVAQLEKLLKRHDMELPERLYFTPPPSGTNLKRAHHPERAVAPSSERLAAVGKKLAKLVGE